MVISASERAKTFDTIKGLHAVFRVFDEQSRMNLYICKDSITLKCVYCGNETDYLITDDKPICFECAQKLQMKPCVRCGKYFSEKDSIGNENLCCQCAEQE